MLNSKQLVALVAALFAQEAIAMNAHRHAHAQFHAKKDVVYVDDVVTVTDWTTVTVYDDGAPIHTTKPKAIFKGGAHTEGYAKATTSSKKTSTKTTSSSSTSTSKSTTAPTTTALPTTSTTPKPAPTTLTTSVVRAPSPKATTSTTAPKVEVQAQVDTTTAVAAAAAPTTAAQKAATTQASSSSSGSSSGAGKRGLAYNAGNLLAPFLGSGSKCTWSYNWGQQADSSAPSSLEFVPMLWGPTHADGWSSNAEAAIANGAKNFLSFNECDNAGQCNLDPASAAAAHKQYMNPYSGRVRIGTPAITNSQNAGEGVSWLTSFLSACGGNCAYDFCAAHWYNGPDTSDFLNHLVDVHNACGKPVWITEFAPTGSDDQISAFLETVMEQLDTNPTYSFVERYSYFMAATGSLLSGTSSLSSYGNTYAYN